MNDEPDRTARHPVGSPAFFEALVDLAVSPFVVIDDDLVLHYASSSVTTMLGWRPDEWIGRNAAELLTEESLGVVALGLHDLDEAPNDPDWVAAPVRMFIKHADGTIVPIDATARPPERTGVDGIVVQLHRAGATQAMSDAVDAILDGTDLEGALTQLASLIEHDIGNSSAVLASDWDRRRFAQIAGTNTLLTLHQPRPRDRAAIQMALESGDAVTELFSHLDPATQSEAIAAGLHTCWCAPIPPFDHDEPTAALFVWHVGQDPPGPIYTSDISRSVNLARLALRWMGQQRLLAWDAAHDHLTGLINRSEFQNQLDASAGHARAVLYFDLDEAPNDPDWVAAPVRMYIKHVNGTIVPIDATARPPERTGVDG
ncbi:MAG TPA: PAS domain S-box protein, partial [Protaetiibacter sp.]|nr:PAS domain S-box protein [Protaetiibacter sp.]